MPLTWHSLLHTVEGVAAVATVALAVGTVLLALAALWTARRTRELASETARLAGATELEVKAVLEQAEAAREEVGLSRAALQAGFRPCLIDVPPSETSDGSLRHPARFVARQGNTAFSVPARNVGSGVAFVRSVTMHFYDEGQPVDSPSTYIGTVPMRVVPPGERLWSHFSFPPSEEERVKHIHDLGYFWVEIDYLDVSGSQAETARLDLKLLGGHTWRVTELSLTREGDTEPYVSSQAPSSAWGTVEE